MTTLGWIILSGSIGTIIGALIGLATQNPGRKNK